MISEEYVHTGFLDYILSNTISYPFPGCHWKVLTETCEMKHIILFYLN